MMKCLLQKASACFVLLLSTVVATFAQGTAAPSQSPSDSANWKPAWLTEVSLSVREGYDNNVYGNGWDYPVAGWVRPILNSYPALPNKGSFFEEVTPKIAVDFAKLQSGPTEDNVVQKLAFSYAPDLFNYDSAYDANYTAHRLTSAIALKCHDVSFLLDEAFTDIDGNKYAPTFPGKLYSAYGHAIDRERLSQLQDRTTVSIKYDQDSWFLRPTGSLLGYDLHTVRSNAATANAGYLNYVDRFDINGGADVGYKLDKDLAVTLGYRVGKQYQQLQTTAIDPYQQTADSDYQRLLAGIEGKITSWLTGKVQAGPDFRNYGPTAPVRDNTPISYYGEGSLTAALTTDDSLGLGYRQSRWVSSTGLVPTYESKYDLTYKHQINSQWSTKLGACLQSSDYTIGEAWAAGAGNHSPATAPTNFRYDMLYTFTAGVQYAVTANLTVDVAFNQLLGRNMIDDGYLAAAQLPVSKREFDDQVTSVGVQYKF